MILTKIKSLSVAGRRAGGSSLKFALTASTDPDSLSARDILTGAAYRWAVSELSLAMFEQHAPLNEVLQAGMVPRVGDLSLEHFSLDGRFDRVVCRLWLNNPGPTRFLVTTHFSKAGKVVTVAAQDGVLAFEDLA